MNDKSVPVQRTRLMTSALRSAILYAFLVLLIVQLGRAEDGGLPSAITPVAEDTSACGYSFVMPYPNPFSPVYTLEIVLPDTAFVTLFVVDVAQSDTIWLARKERLAPGTYEVPSHRIVKFTARQSKLLFRLRAEGSSVSRGAGTVTSTYKADLLLQWQNAQESKE